jgi:chromate reductase, NAD(P)H dehydrogenase (quinone)
MSIKVVGIPGSLREGSFNRGLLRTAIELAPTKVEIQVDKGNPEPVQALKTAIRQADAMLIATPDYNYGVLGVLKNAIDWASRPPGQSVLNRKPAAIMGCSQGLGGTIRAQHALRQSFVFTETLAMLQPEIKIPSVAKLFDASGKLTDENTRQHIQKFLEAFVQWIARFKPERDHQKSDSSM